MAGELEATPGTIIRATWWELTHALQAEIDITAETLPLAQLRQHLLRRWEDRKLISAQKAEDLVAALLKEHHGGEVTRLMANANVADGGIDLYLSHSGDGKVQRAVQVKRRISTDVESVKEVRNFVGAMVLDGCDEGIFVTTASRFSTPARNTPRKAQRAKFRLKLELIDGEKLLEMLRATTAPLDVQLPPMVDLDQEFKNLHGRSVLARDLFIGDINHACRL
jgi:restriction endonuclease Mrr